MISRPTFHRSGVITHRRRLSYLTCSTKKYRISNLLPNPIFQISVNNSIDIHKRFVFNLQIYKNKIFQTIKISFSEKSKQLKHQFSEKSKQLALSKSLLTVPLIRLRILKHSESLEFPSIRAARETRASREKSFHQQLRNPSLNFKYALCIFNSPLKNR